MADEKSREVGELHVKVNVDVSEALTGLKAVQREAREATKALRELEEAQKPKFKDIHVEVDGKAVRKIAVDDLHTLEELVTEDLRSNQRKSGVGWSKDSSSVSDDIRRSYE